MFHNCIRFNMCLNNWLYFFILLIFHHFRIPLALMSMACNQISNFLYRLPDSPMLAYMFVHNMFGTTVHIISHNTGASYSAVKRRIDEQSWLDCDEYFIVPISGFSDISFF